jgi:hypothetical protein
MNFTDLKKYFLVVLIVSFSKSFSQEITNIKGDFEINLGYGNANIAIENDVANGFYSSFKAKKEFLLNKRYSLVTGFDLLNLHFNSNDNSIENKYLGIPISFRANIRNDKDAMFAEFGGYAYYLSNSNITDNLLNITTKEKNLGNNFGVFFKMGYKKYFNENLKFNLAIVNSQDISSNFKKSVPTYQINNQIGLEFGLCLNL